MALGPETVAVNGERTNVPQAAAYFPHPYGPQTQGVPNVTPSYPPYLGGAPLNLAPGAESVGGYGTAGNNAQVTALANAHPWNLKVSPVWWAIIGLVVSLVALKAIHWRDTILEGEEALDFGPVGERAEAEAHA